MKDERKNSIFSSADEDFNLKIMTGINDIIADYPIEELTEMILQCAEYVHKRIGSGFHELVYKRPMACELFFRNIPFEQEELVIGNNADQALKDKAGFIVDGRIRIELRSSFYLDQIYTEQIFDQQEYSNIQVGLIISFGTEKLEFRLIKNPKYDTLKQHRQVLRFEIPANFCAESC
jgi:GxxExxY protein